MVPMLALVGLRWASVAAAISTVAAVAVPWAPTVAVVVRSAVAWLVLFSPAGRIGIAAGGARLLLRGVRPGSYPRGGSVHVRLWAATRLAELSGATGVAGASWTTRYARALGAKIGNDVDLHSAPPVTGMLKIGRGAAVAPEVDLGGYWVDGDVVRIGKIRIGAGATVGSRSTLLPGRADRQGRRDRAPGRRSRGAVPAGQRWAGVARAAGGQGRRVVAVDPPAALARAGRSPTASRRCCLGLLPAVAALPALAIVAVGVAGTASPAEATSGALLMVAPATVAYLAHVRGARRGRRAPARHRHGRGLPPGAQPRGLAGLGHGAADGHGPHGPVPAVLQPVHGRVAAAARRQDRPGRRGVDGDRAAEDDHGRGRRVPRRRHDGRHLRALRRLDARRRRRGSASRPSSATPG